MTKGNETTVDFIARGHSPDEWRMVLVEQGPWPDEISDNLRHLQGRLFGCAEAAIDGRLAERIPESFGKKVVIQVDCYDVPRREVEAFFRRFSHGILELEDYRKAISASRFISGMAFEITFDNIH